MPFEIYCDECCDPFSPVEYHTVSLRGLNFCSWECEREWVQREE